MAQVNPYYTFNGTCEAAFQLYKSVFGGEFSTFMRFRDVDPTNAQGFSEETLDKIMHVALPISSETVIMGSDNRPNDPPVTNGGHLSISVNVSSKEEAENIFNGLANGGTVTMPLSDTFWGAYFGMLTDKFGNHWMVNYDMPKA